MAKELLHVHSPEQLRSIGKMLQRGGLSRRERLYLIDELTAHGLWKMALRRIEAIRLEIRNKDMLAYMERQERINRRIGTLEAFPKIQENRALLNALLSDKHAYFTGHKHPEKLIVVVASLYNNFNLSFPVLHAMLRPYGHSIFYVKNPDKGFFLQGVAGLGDSIPAMAKAIRTRAEEKLGEIEEIRVMGLSSGGYAAVHLAGLMSARGLLGFGVSTDLRPGSPLRMGKIAQVFRDDAANIDALHNLRDLPETRQIDKAVLYYGGRTEGDRDQAENMRDLLNFEVIEVPDSTHTVLLSLLAEGRLEQVLDRFLAGEKREPEGEKSNG